MPSTSTESRELAEHAHHRARAAPVEVAVGRDDDQLRAAPAGDRDRQGGVDAELARLVGGGGDDAAVGPRGPTATGSPRSFGPAQQLAGDEERVHVHVRDRVLPPGGVPVQAFGAHRIRS